MDLLKTLNTKPPAILCWLSILPALAATPTIAHAKVHYEARILNQSNLDICFSDFQRDPRSGEFPRTECPNVITANKFREIAAVSYFGWKAIPDYKAYRISMQSPENSNRFIPLCIYRPVDGARINNDQILPYCKNLSNVTSHFEAIVSSDVTKGVKQGAHDKFDIQSYSITIKNKLDPQNPATQTNFNTDFQFGHQFSLAVTSDPQFGFGCAKELTRFPTAQSPYCASSDKKPDSNAKGQSEDVNQKQVSAIQSILKDKRVVSSEGDETTELDVPNLMGIVINGDLTEFGNQDGQLDLFKKHWFNDTLRNQLPIWPGLGNHDIVSPLNDCGFAIQGIIAYKKNYCIYDMNKFMARFVGFAESSTGMGSNWGNWQIPFGVNRDMARVTWHNSKFSGSMAYSWEIDNFHFIQLHYHPLYSAEYEYYLGKHRQDMKISSSLDWLKKDIKLATENGKHIIINIHALNDVYDIWKNKFTAALKEADKNKKIKAIFVGHIHNKFGKDQATWTVRYDDQTVNEIPVFYSGSAIWNKFLLVKFRSNYPIKPEFVGPRRVDNCGSEINDAPTIDANSLKADQIIVQVIDSFQNDGPRTTTASDGASGCTSITWQTSTFVPLHEPHRKTM